VLGESPAVCGLEITEFALQKTRNIGDNNKQYHASFFSDLL
jgi:hypothetical protein